MTPALHRLAARFLSLRLPLACIALQARHAHQGQRHRVHHPGLAPRYEIERTYAPYLPPCEEERLPLHRILCELDPGAFPSASQARRAIEHGRLLVLRADEQRPRVAGVGIAANELVLNAGTVANSTTGIRNNDILAVRSRVPNEFYPQPVTKYVDPPRNAAEILSHENTVVFEDDHIAVVNKPEWLDTIGENRNDLQSMLPFILRPPSVSSGKNPMEQTCYLPRPIHRLDRRTSGCVLVAKTEDAMKRYSRMFAKRQVRKSYCAVTFGEPTPGDDGQVVEVDGKAFHTIDYPIHGKDAVTLWRTISTVDTTWGKLSLLHLLPKTGRNHQIRRHLSYCLSCPIVGDSKYDGGYALAKEARKRGMFLCSNSIQFEHMNEGAVSVNIPLPDKFYDILGVDKENASMT